MNIEGSIALVTGANEAGEHEVLVDDWTGGARRASGRSDGHDDDEETSPCDWHSVP